MKIDKTIIMVTAVIRDSESKVLLLKRSKANKTYHNNWQLVEGHLNDNENPTDGLIREAQEEINCKLSKINLNKVTISHLKRKDIVYQLVRLVFGATIKGSISLSQDHVDFKWISLKEVTSYKLFPGTREILR
jgi:ADP-ribose pyrophosphatase YjhB (NUDIX family)